MVTQKQLDDAHDALVDACIAATKAGGAKRVLQKQLDDAHKALSAGCVVVNRAEASYRTASDKYKELIALSLN